MKIILKTSAFILLAGTLLYVSCKKEYSCGICRETNKPPKANAGKDSFNVLPTDSFTLDGRASGDPDGIIRLYKWVMIAGPGLPVIIQPDSSKTLVKSLLPSIYAFELTVKDDGGLSAKDTLQMIVHIFQFNWPPLANAGADQVIMLPTNTIKLDGTGSADPDNNISAYKWTKISGPFFFDINNANTSQTTVTSLIQGEYWFELNVTDAGGLSSKEPWLYML